MNKLDLASVKRRYMLDIDLYERTYSKWNKRGQEVVKRYRDERSDIDGSGARYNILWSNVQTVLPAVFARLPKPEVSRRYKDADPVGRVAAQILERVLQYEIEKYPDYASAVHNSVEDRLLPGRGIAWVRYEPRMKAVELPQDGASEEAQISEDVESDEAKEESQKTAEVIDYECSPVDYVHWQDFGHNVARTWEEVHVVWRKVPLTRKDCIERFGEELGAKIPLDQKCDMDDEALATPEAESLQKATIYEIWDKREGRAVWISKAYDDALDVRDDPLGLEEFFPCPKPLYSTVTTGSLVPVPDYALYQDQAEELNILCDRIDGLIKALKVVGVYDSTQTGVQRMLSEGVNNTLIPVESWLAFGEKGGLKGVIDMLPLDMVVQALNAAYVARDQIKSVIYEVTGIADIIRGSSNPNETLGAQRLKGQFASLRLKKLQSMVADFATGLLRIKAQIICKHYQPETLVMMSGVQQMPQQDQALVEQAIALLRNEAMRGFRIDVSSDSLLEVDEQQEKADRMEFLGSVGGFLREALQAPPEMAPLLGEMLLFGIRGFKAGRSMEGVFEETMETMRQKAEQPQVQQPDPMAAKLQAEQQLAEMRLQAEREMQQIRLQAEQERESMRLRLEVQAKEAELALEERTQAMQMMMEQEFARWKAELDAATKVETANIASKNKLENEATIAATAEISKEIQQ